MLRLENLSLYLSKDLRPLVRDFSFVLSAGKKVALIGEEGNGKSALLKAIADPKSIQSYIEVRGQIHKAGEILGYLPQIFAKENLEQTTQEYLGAAFTWGFLDYGRYYALLNEMGFPENRISPQIKVGELSGGEKIKFHLLREMLKNPTALLLDEPSNDLDLVSAGWLEQFIRGLKIPVLFVSHDELLLKGCANSVIHLEQLAKKRKAQHTIANVPYSKYSQEREKRLAWQMQVAKKEKEEYDAKMARHRRIFQRVEHELRTVSRQDPVVGKNLKDKMRSVKSMGKRLGREKEKMAKKPDFEESIALSFPSHIYIPNGKKILELDLAVLKVGARVLSRNLRLSISGPQKICIVGANGSGKTTLLRYIVRELANQGLSYGYMPQNYGETENPQQSAIRFLTSSQKKEELTRARAYLGSLNFTEEEMWHPLARLSGGQRAKLYFSRMVFTKAEILILDEPTRNLSPLSGPEIRRALREFKGCILAVSHDRQFIKEVCSQVLLLDADGLRPWDAGLWEKAYQD